MKYLKMLGLAAVAAATLMAWTGIGTVSAATLTCGGVVCPIGTVVEAENEGHVTLHPSFGSITCKESLIASTTTALGGKVEGVTKTVKSHSTKLRFINCNEGGATVTVLQPGTFEVHSLGNGNSTLRSNGIVVTTIYLGFHCIFETNNTAIGTVTSNTTTPSQATTDIFATLLAAGGGSGAFCGSTAQWTGFYKITKPNPLVIH